MTKGEGHPAEHVAAHLERAGRPDAALALLETAAGEASRAGQAGREATLQVGALQLAARHQTLAGWRASLETAAIKSLFAVGRFSELDPLLRNAWPRRQGLSPADRARLAALFTGYLFWTGSMDHALIVAREELGDLEQGRDLDSAGFLLRESALVAWFRGDAAAARAFIGRALDVAQRIGDPDLEFQARRFEILIAFGEHGDRSAGISRLRESVAIARAKGLSVPDDMTRLALSLFTGSVRGVTAARQASERVGAWSWLAAMYDAALRLMEGNHGESEAVFGRIRHGYRLRIPTLAAWVDAKEACLYLHRGDLDQARKLLSGPSAANEAASCGLIGADWSSARGWLAWEEGRFSEASAYLADAGADSVMRTYNIVSPGPAFLAMRVDALLRLECADEAAAAIAAVEAFNLGHSRFVAAALAAARFRLHPVPEEASIAGTVTAAAPWPWLHALVGCWRGEFLQDAKAAQEAREQFEAVGARRGVQRAEGVLRRLGVSLLRAARGSGVLSARELEVAELIAEGLSNPGIARRLYLSRPTVASHVAPAHCRSGA